jgi:tetratricopeptide (TPR) repeat protein
VAAARRNPNRSKLKDVQSPTHRAGRDDESRKMWRSGPCSPLEPLCYNRCRLFLFPSVEKEDAAIEGGNQCQNGLMPTILLSCWSSLAWANAAFDCSQDKDVDLRIDGCTRYIKKNPKIAGAYENRSLAYLDKGDLDRAIADATKAVRLNPKSATAYQG